MTKFVGFCRIEILDEHKGITFPMLVMYPTCTPAKPVTFGPFSLDVAIEAPVEDGSFPLVMISHGSGGSYLTHRTLGANLAKNGFVVCMPEHPFNNRNNNEWQYTLENLTHRPRHIRLAIDQVLSHDKLKNHLASDRVAIIGHSVGGYTALAVAGGVPHTQFIVEFCQRSENQDLLFCTIVRRNELKPQKIAGAADSRIKAVVLFAPDVSLFMSDGALSNVNVPVLLLVAEKEDTPLETAEIVMNGLPDSSQLSYRMVENAGHYSFLSPFPESIKNRLGGAARDPASFDRDRFHEELNMEVLDFLQRELEVDH